MFLMRGQVVSRIWLRESTICVDFGLVPCFGLDMLYYHEHVVRSWIGYVIMVYDKLFDYVMLLLLCCVILFYVYPVIRGFLLSLGSRVCG